MKTIITVIATCIIFSFSGNSEKEDNIIYKIVTRFFDSTTKTPAILDSTTSFFKDNELIGSQVKEFSGFFSSTKECLNFYVDFYNENKVILPTKSIYTDTLNYTIVKSEKLDSI